MNAAVVTAHKLRLAPWLRALASCPTDETTACLAALAHPTLAWHGPHPIGGLHGLEAVSRRFWRPLKHAFPDLERRDDILIGGSDGLTGGADGEWVAATGHFVGSWQRDWLGLPATGRLAYLRFGEFHRIEGGRVAESRVLLDLPDLMRQSGCNPLPSSSGAELLVPGPSSNDGLPDGMADPLVSAASLRLVEGLGLRALRRQPGADEPEPGPDGAWSAHFMRYGPCGIGSTRGLAAFQCHQVRPFLRAFPDGKVAERQLRIADGQFVATTGWPGLRATHRGPFLGIPPTGERVALRAMEFWRCEGSALAESWSLLDLPHLLLQIGYDLVAEARETALAA